MTMNDLLRQLARSPTVRIGGQVRSKRGHPMLLGRQQMNKYTKYKKLVKYMVLCQLPGKLGRLYKRKYMRLQAKIEAQVKFEEATPFPGHDVH